eukprot:COSAG05_NODE_971_length_6368_cov_3.026320_3_plen_515_part_00
MMPFYIGTLFSMAVAARARARSRTKTVEHTRPPVSKLAHIDLHGLDASLARDGSTDVAYGGTPADQGPDGTMFTPRNGALFDEPLELENCDGDWRCTKRSTKNSAHSGLQHRNGDANFCDFPVVSADELTTEFFEATFLDRTPVLIRRDPNGGKEPFRTRNVLGLLTRNGLTKTFGRHSADVGNSLEIVHSQGPGGPRMNIGEFVQTFMPREKRPHLKGEPLYIFQRGVVGDDLLVPSIKGLFSAAHQHVNIWMVGGPLSGTTFHFHAAAWTGVIYGRKRWFLYPPTMTPPGGGSGSNMVPTFPITYWLSDVYPRLAESHKPVECMQHPGDLLYIPEGWYHAVLNVDDVVAVTFQNGTYNTEFQKLITSHSTLEDRERARSANQEWGHQSDRLDLNYFIGISLLQRNRFVQAAQEFRKVVDADPNYAAAWSLLGESMAELGRLKEADKYYRHAIALYPPGRRPRAIYRQFLASHPDPNGTAASGLKAPRFDPGDRLVEPKQLVAVDMDPFALLD